MAQHFQIPVAFEFKPLTAQWVRADFQIERREKHTSIKSSGELAAIADPPEDAREEMFVRPILKTASGRSKHIEPSQLFTPQPSELALHFQVAQELRNDGFTEPASLREVLLSFGGGVSNGRVRDAWAMRAEFLALPEDTLALQQFVNRWGVWDQGSLEAQLFRFNLMEFVEAMKERRLGCISPFLVWRERKRLKEGMLMPPEDWLSSNASLTFGTNRKAFPFIGTEVNVCLKALEATITFDHLRKVKSRICARPDCDAIFTVNSKHGKIYCDQSCAHLESVRRNRAAAKASKRPARKAVK